MPFDAMLAMLFGVVHDVFFFNDTATTEIYTLSLHDALPIYRGDAAGNSEDQPGRDIERAELDALVPRSEEHTSELQSPDHLVCRLLLEKKKTIARLRFPDRSNGSSIYLYSAVRVESGSYHS